MLAALANLGVGLQAVAQLAQQPRDRPEADLMTLLAQALGELAHRPAQRPLRVAATITIDEALEIRKQRRILLDQALTAPARPTHPPRRQALTAFKLAEALANRRL